MKSNNPTGSKQHTTIPLLDEPPLGHVQAVILKTLDDLGKDAYGYSALQTIAQVTGVWLNHAQVYTILRKLAEPAKTDPMIEHTETRPSTGGGPPFKVYKLTAAGRAALKATHAHHKALVSYLENDKRRPSRS